MMEYDIHTLLDLMTAAATAAVLYAMLATPVRCGAWRAGGAATACTGCGVAAGLEGGGLGGRCSCGAWGAGGTCPGTKCTVAAGGGEAARTRG